jgi:CO/xanthine dehydrogenase Mo-binding subunit
MTFQTVGKRKPKYEGMAHVTGETKFVDDMFVPRTLTVKAFRSPVHKGRILKLDTSKAEQMDGVAGVITYKDVPANAYGFGADQPVLVETNIRYKGEPIAAVAAEDEATAHKALDAITIEIEEQEPVFDPLKAMEPDAPQVVPGGNVMMFDGVPYNLATMGDVEAGFKEADHIIEGTYFFPDQEHTAMETQVSLVVPEAAGRITVYSVCQDRSMLLGMLAGILQLGSEDALKCECASDWAGRTRSAWRHHSGLNRLKMQAGPVGGGFGGKNEFHADPITAILALKTGRPCKWRWTREEEILYSTHREAMHITYKDGVKNDGRIVARYIRTIRDSGAYVGFNGYATGKTNYFANGPYYVPNLRVESAAVFTNKPVSSTMRGFAVAPVTFAVEAQMYKVAKTIGMDPLEFRFKNAMRRGDKLVNQQVMNDTSLIEVMQTLAKKAGVELPDQLCKMTSNDRRA